MPGHAPLFCLCLWPGSGYLSTNGSRISARANPFGVGHKCQRTKSPEHPSTWDRWGVVGKQPASLPNRGTVLVYSLCPSTTVCQGWSCHPGLAALLPCLSFYPLPAPSGVTSTQAATFTSWVRSVLGEPGYGHGFCTLSVASPQTRDLPAVTEAPLPSLSHI